MENDIKIAVIDNDKIDYMYIGLENTSYFLPLSEYVKYKYPESINRSDIDFKDTNSMGLYLREQGNIVFFNNTTYKEGKIRDEKRGIFIMPDQMTSDMKQLLLEFNKQLASYDSLQIWHSFESHIECKTLFTKNKQQVLTIVDYYVDTYGKTK